MSGQNKGYRSADELGLSPEEWREAWSSQMLVIWREKMSQLDINDTGALNRSLSAHMDVNGNEGKSVITHRFEMYGLFVDAGTGRGFERGNNGALDIMDKAYRKAKGMRGEPREPKRWFSYAYYRSVKNLIEHEAKVLGEKFVGAITNAFGGNQDASKYL